MPGTRNCRPARARRFGASLLCASLLCATALPAWGRPGLAAKAPRPLNGAYAMSGLRVCGAGQAPVPGAAPAPALFRTDTAQISFTPLGTLPFAEWLEEISLNDDPVTTPPGWDSASATLTNTSNPASPASNLVETPVEWGQLDIANFRAEIAAPGAAITETLKTGPTWFFITQYGFGEGVALDTYTTGYALYVWKDETDDWTRYVIDLNGKLTFTAAAAAAHASFQKNINGVAYYCLRQVQLHQ